MTTLRVAETFGPTVQGEGPTAGRLCAFVRLSGCNLDCSFCDTPFTWDWTGKNGRAYDRQAEATTQPVEQLASLLAGYDVPTIVITGGEPLTQQSHVESLVRNLTAVGLLVEVETNGTIEPMPGMAAMVTQWNVSPKLANSGVDAARREKPTAIRALRQTGRAVFKFVCDSPAAVEEVVGWCERHTIDPACVWIMPEGTTTERITSGFGQLVDAAIAYQFNVTSRLHVLAWGDERGR